MYLFSRIGHFKKIILKERGFRCGSDEKMMRMWFGLEIDVVGLPPLLDPTVRTRKLWNMMRLLESSFKMSNEHITQQLYSVNRPIYHIL